MKIIKNKKIRFNNGFERAIKLKDIEAARMLELNDTREKNEAKNNPKQPIPVVRSDLPKE